MFPETATQFRSGLMKVVSCPLERRHQPFWPRLVFQERLKTFSKILLQVHMLKGLSSENDIEGYFRVYLSQLEVERTDLTSQNHNSYFTINSPWETFRDVLRIQRASQSASQEWILATNQRPRLPTCDQSVSQECRFVTYKKRKKKNKPGRFKQGPAL